MVLPLSLPGVFAGSLLTFIPASGDFINAELLGSPNQQMIGTVIQNQFLQVRDYPLAAALSFVLMVDHHRRRAALRPRPRHRGPRLMTPRTGAVDPAGPRLGCSDIYGGAGAAVSLPADLRDHPVQLQQAGREVQLRLEGVLARRLAGSRSSTRRWSTR